MGSAWLAGLPGLIHTYPEIPLAIASFFFILFIHRLKYSRSHLPINWPVIGMIPALFAHAHHLHDWLTDVLMESGCTYVFKGPWKTRVDLLLTCDPANVNHVFNANFANYPKGNDFGAMFDILGDGIFNADGESWKFQRKKAHAVMADPGFRSHVVNASRDKVEKGLIPLLNEFAEEHAVVDLQDVFQRLTFDTTCMLILGVDPGCLSTGLPPVAFAKAIDVAEEVLFFRHTVPASWWKALRRLGLWKEKEMAMAWKTIDHVIAQYIARRREEKSAYQRDGTKCDKVNTDLLASYLESEAETGKTGAEFDRFLRDTVLNLMVAGRDTTSAALTWFFWLLSKNPEVEAKIIEELKLHHHSSLEKADLGRLVYLHAALCETLRLFPPVPFEHKQALRPAILPSGIKVHRRRRILFSLYAMGRMEAIWGKDCLEFKPERWISDSGRLRYEPSYKFLSFNSGPRTCLGKDMAFTQMKVVAAAIITNFCVQVVEGHVARPKLSIILHMKGGLKVRVTKKAACLI